MDEVSSLIRHYGLSVVFLNVVLEQLGAPIPAIPVLMVAGAFAMKGGLSLTALVLVAVLASLIADFIWYRIGQRFGYRVLGTLCRISLSPDACVRQTESIFGRWGSATLLIAKFIPGFSTIAPPLAGALRVPRLPFVLFDLAGTLLWVLVAVGAGMLFQHAIRDLLDMLSGIGYGAAAVLVGIVLLVVGFKWWERQRFYKTLRMARITVAELQHLIHSGERPTIVDVRSALQQVEGHIPGAVLLEKADMADGLPGVPMNQEIIVYCNCPNEASAAQVARALMDKGFMRVRPLKGGLDAWIEAGFDVERPQTAADRTAAQGQL